MALRNNDNRNNEPEVEVITSPVDSVEESPKVEESTEDREGRAAKLAVKTYGEEYDIQKVVVNGDIANVLANRKGDTTQVALPLDI